MSSVQLCVFFQEEPSETKLTLRPPSLAAPYAPVQSWQHQPEKLIFESCGYEANVSGSRSPRWQPALPSGAGCAKGTGERTVLGKVTPLTAE